MNLQHVNVKVPVDGPLEIDLARFIEVFHGWVSAQSADEMLIDVADYRHVPSGPGVLLVGLEADYGMDNAGGRFGLLYNRKAPLDGSNRDRFRAALHRALGACQRLETELPGLKFDRQQFELFINDRALAPNTTETWEACQADLESFVKEDLGQGQFELQRETDARRRFGVTVKLSAPLELSAQA